MKTYLEKAIVSKNSGFKANRMVAVLWGFFRVFIFGFFCYNFYMATVFIQNGVVNPTTGELYSIVEIIAVPQSLIAAIMQIYRAVENLAAYQQALVMGAKVFKVIDRVPMIKDDDNVQQTQEKLQL